MALFLLALVMLGCLLSYWGTRRVLGIESLEERVRALEGR